MDFFTKKKIAVNKKVTLPLFKKPTYPFIKPMPIAPSMMRPAIIGVGGMRKL